MSGGSATLVLYMPAFHAGYDAAFKRVAGSVNRLLILGKDLASEFPPREIRQADPASMVKAVRGLGYFDEVLEAGIADLEALDGSDVWLADDYLTQAMHERHFPKVSVTKVPVFLRWDEATVKGAYGDAEYDVEITQEAFHCEVMKKAEIEAQNSSDWFRRVGAALVVDGDIRLVTHNQRMPSPHEPWAVGDPRMYLDYGSDPHLRTTVHAEEGLIVGAAREGVSTEGGWIYATTYPCPGCAGMIAMAGISRVYFREGYAALHGEDILKAYGVERIRVSQAD